ncbi:MAG: AhpC/TSA family protein [Cyclobacteriaceae bacterium]|nr:AhpC/TSA family protein [Cyclobacteriaceae bacterium]
MSRLTSGSPAIDFTINDYQGNPISLSDYLGEKILLSFFRGASCPFCNLRVHELIKRYPDFEKQGIHIIGLFASTAEEINKYAGKQQPPFAIIPDPALSLYKKYKVEATQMGMLKAMLQPAKMWSVMTSKFFNMNAIADKPLIPADFLIDEKSVIQRAYYGNDFGDHVPIEDVLGWRVQK